MYQVSVQSYIALTNVTLLMSLSTTPSTSYIAFMMKQNWFESSFPMPLNTCSFTEFTILNSGGGGGVGDQVSGGGKDGGGVDG